LTKKLRNKKILLEEGLGGLDSSRINASIVSSKTVGSSQAEEGMSPAGR
jgi:hypothetical protein